MTAPVIFCMADDGGWRFWCHKYHRHGAPLGHRVAHCHSDAGQHAYPCGYVLAAEQNAGAE